LNASLRLCRSGIAKICSLQVKGVLMGAISVSRATKYFTLSLTERGSNKMQSESLRQKWNENVGKSWCTPTGSR
jgi:hypothetical protein